MGFDGFAKRSAPIAVCMMLALAAYFQASGLMQLVGGILAPANMVPPFRAASFVLPSLTGSERDLHATSILERNVFDHITGPIIDGPKDHTGGEKADAEAPGTDWYKDPPCEVAKVVLIVSSEDPAWSFAAITGPDGKTALRRRGEEFFGGKVAFVGDQRPSPHPEDEVRGLWDRVWLTAPNGSRCQLQLGAKLPGRPTMAPPGPPPGGLSPDLASKIRKRGEHEFDVDRTAVDALIANPAELMKTRVTPVKDDGGRVVGLRLGGIRSDSVLSAIGLQNGDQLTSINGFEMNDPQKMLEAYSKLMRADHLAVSVLRNGKPVSLDFSIK
jgi:general secretion pathway protein C